MPRNRFVKPKTVTLQLSDGDWIEVKRELNAGEERRVFGRLVKEMRSGEKVTLEPEQVGLTKLVEYLIGWSFTDDTGKAVAVSESAILALDTETYVELVKVIDEHTEAIDTERAARKNVPATATASAAT